MDPNNHLHPLLHTGEVRISTLPETCLHPKLFERAWALRPSIQSNIYIKRIGPHPAHRRYRSYGNTPAMASDAKTYMFSADGSVSAAAIPELFQGIMDHLNEAGGGQYNQLSVNWYQDGTDYCPIHMDCLTGLRPHSNIAIVTLMEPCAEDQRTLIFKPTPLVSSPPLCIPTTHGQCVEFGGTALTQWRHGLPKTEHALARRISLSFRSYVEEMAETPSSSFFALNGQRKII